VFLARFARRAGFMLWSRIRIAVVLSLTLLGVRTTAQQAQPREQPAPQPTAQGAGNQPQTPPTFRGGINYVRVDAIVTDRRGQPVFDLKQSDFEVLEDGKPQAVDSFKLIRVDGNPKPGDPPPRAIRSRDDEEAEAARDDVRVYVILLDDYHVRNTNAMRMRDILSRFIQQQLRPMDLVAVMYPLTPVSALDFTRDFESVSGAVQKFEGRKYDYRPRNATEEQYQRYPTETIEQIRNDVVMGALKGLSVRLGSVRESRKHVIFVSEGFTVQLPAAMRRADASIPDAPCLVAGQQNCNPAINNPLGNETQSGREQTAAWFAQSDLYSKMRDVFDLANRNNVSIYTLDPRGLAVSEFGIDENIGPQQDARSLQVTQDTLRVLAEETDGRAIVNRNSLDAGLAQITADASFYYLLGSNSTQAPTDGKFHEIKVRVKRSGVEVRARKGYWAATAEDLARAANPTPELAKPIQQALASIATSVQSGKYIRTWIGSERGENGKTRMTLVWEPLPAQPGVTRETPGRVSVLAASEKGDLLFRGRTPDAALASTAPPQQVPRPATPAGNTPQKLIFDVPPGKVELRLTVEGAAGGGTLDQEIRTIDVPDLTGPQVAISTPRVFRARTVPEFRTFANDPNAAPVAAREFSRTERLLILFDAYGPVSDRPVPTAALMNRTGQKMADVPVAPAATGTGYQIDLSLNGVPPGEYLVEITAKSAAGEARELVAVRVTG
jgi:VWFA-related protein